MGSGSRDLEAVQLLAMMGNGKTMYMNVHENGSLLHFGGFSKPQVSRASSSMTFGGPRITSRRTTSK